MLSALDFSGLRTVGIALVVALLVGAAGGGWLAWQWTSGRQATAENKQLRADLEQAVRTAAELRAAAVDLPAALHAAIGRLNAISQERENDREALRNFATGLAADLERLSRGNPALRDLDLGADFLRHWNRANAGPASAAGAPAAGATGQPGAAVPGPAGSGKQPAAGDSGGARQGGGDVPRLPQRERQVDRGGAGMAGHGVALVLRSGRTDRAGARRLHG